MEKINELRDRVCKAEQDFKEAINEVFKDYESKQEPEF